MKILTFVFDLRNRNRIETAVQEFPKKFDKRFNIDGLLQTHLSVCCWSVVDMCRHLRNIHSNLGSSPICSLTFLSLSQLLAIDAVLHPAVTRWGIILVLLWQDKEEKELPTSTRKSISHTATASLLHLVRWRFLFCQSVSHTHKHAYSSSSSAHSPQETAKYSGASATPMPNCMVTHSLTQFRNAMAFSSDLGLK